MQNAYQETRFRQDRAPDAWPERFVIITASPPSGAGWSEQRSNAAQAHLTAILADLHCWIHRLAGYSSVTGHAEPGWAVDIGPTHGVELGRQFLQDAIFFVEDDLLWVVECDEEAAMTSIGWFSERLDAVPAAGV